MFFLYILFLILSRIQIFPCHISFVFLILPAEIYLNDALSETRICLTHFPKSFPSPIFSEIQALQENPLPGKYFLCNAYELCFLNVFSIYTVPDSFPYTNFPVPYFICFSYPPSWNIFKWCLVRNSNLFNTLPQKFSEPRFLWTTGPPRKPSSWEIFHLFFLSSQLKYFLCNAYELSFLNVFSIYTVPDSFPYTNFPVPYFICFSYPPSWNIFKWCLVRNSNLFNTLPQKFSEPCFLWTTGPPRKPSSREIFPLQCIWTMLFECFFYIYCSWFFPVYKFSRIQIFPCHISFVFLILPAEIYLNDALSEPRICLTHFLKSFPSPVFSKLQAPQENPLPGKSSLCNAYELCFLNVFSIYTVPDSFPYTNFPVYKFSRAIFHFFFLSSQLKYI